MLACLVRVIAGACEAGMSTVDSELAGGRSSGGVAVAVPVLVIEPASRSAWVVV